MTTLRRMLNFRGPPLAAQILALMLGGLVVAQLVTLALTLFLPPDPPTKYGLNDIASAFANESNASRGLSRRSQSNAPALSGRGWLLAGSSRDDLAKLLGVPANRVVLAFYTPLPFAGTTGVPTSNAHEAPAKTAQVPAADRVRPVAFTPDRDGETYAQSGYQSAVLLVPGNRVSPSNFLRLAQASPGGIPGGPPIGAPGGGFPGGGFPGGGFPGGAPMAPPPGPPPGGMAPTTPPPSAPAGPPMAATAPLGQQTTQSVGPATTVQAIPPGVATPSVAAPTIAVPQSLIMPYPGASAIGRAPDPVATFTTIEKREQKTVPTKTLEPTPPTVTMATKPDAIVPTARPNLAQPFFPNAAPQVLAPTGPPSVTAPVAEVPVQRTGLPGAIDRARRFLGLAPAPFVEGDFVAAVHMPDGSWMVVQPQPSGFLSSWQKRVVLWFVIAFGITAPIGWLFARRLSQPLKRFSEAAAQLGRDPSVAIAALDGPAEIGQAAHAFNLMQMRLRSFVDDRTAMVGAISHDLRTPLTRMRFRIEYAPKEFRDPMLMEVDEMEEMITSVLTFIRDASTPGVRERLDLRVLLDDVAEDAAVIGAAVPIEADVPATVEVDVMGMRRVLTNLVENALKYGEHARIKLTVNADEAIAAIIDDGPGLPEAELEQVFQPFYRTASAKASSAPGTGLGLAVCRSIARAHGGDVVLLNTESGFRAEVRVPLVYEAVRALAA